MKFQYDSRLTYFILSLSWRSLYLDLEEFSCDKTFNKKRLETFIRAEDIMRNYLMGKRKTIENIENHIFFCDRIIEIDNAQQRIENPNTTIHRNITSYSGYNGNTLFTISNLMGIIIVTLYSKGMKESWINTKINKDSGVIEAKNQEVKSDVFQEVLYWSEHLKEAKKKISTKQKKNIEKNILENHKNIKKYPIYQDILDDVNCQVNLRE